MPFNAVCHTVGVRMGFLARVATVAGFGLLPISVALASPCSDALTPAYPREIDPAQTYEALVQWIQDDIIIKRSAPGLVVGISGTDSIVAFLASAEAFRRAGKPERVAGIHFGPSEELMEDNPDASALLWFQNDVIPWLRKRAPGATILVDSTVDFRRDGQRWGALMDFSIEATPLEKTGRIPMRFPHDRYWVVGTRNATEDALFTYSSASKMASVQVLTHLWKSEILKISQFLGAPKKAIEQSCKADCACGRDDLAAKNISEVDALLMIRQGKLLPSYAEQNLSPMLRKALDKYIDATIAGSQFKEQIPYKPEPSRIALAEGLDLAQVAAVKKGLREGAQDQKSFSRLVPQVIAQNRATIATDLAIASATRREHLLPESLVLFNTPGLSANQKKQMEVALFAPQQLVGPSEITEFAALNARLGNYGFSFPQWRFLTQRSGERPTLAEQFGMRALVRPNDVRDATLPDPARDEWGRGFVWSDAKTIIEYRRAYILVSDLASSTTLVIRNNSHYFGRDRLKNAVTLLAGARTPQELQDLAAASLEPSAQAIAWQDVLRTQLDIPVSEKIRRVSDLLDALDRFNDRFSQWLQVGDGARALLAFFEQRKASPLFLGTLDGAVPSWSLSSSLEVTPEWLAHFRQTLDLRQSLPGLAAGRQRWVMMNGPAGDLP